MSHRHEGNCDEAIDALYAFLDGELTDAQRGDVRQHLEGCSGCLEAFDFEAELRHVVQVRCRESLPPGLRERILAALEELQREPSS